MATRVQNLDSIAPVLATFGISQTGGIDDLTDAHIGQAVTFTGDNEVGPTNDGDQLAGRLIGLTMTDRDNGDRLATVQIAGVCRLKTTSTYPQAGNHLVGGAGGTVKQAPAVASDPAGGNIARGTVLATNGTIDCVVVLN